MPGLQEAETTTGASSSEQAMASTSISRLEEGSLRKNSLPPLETPGSRLFLGGDGSDVNVTKTRKGSKSGDDGVGGGKRPSHRSSGDSNSAPNSDNSHRNSMGGGRYAGSIFQDAGPLSSPPIGGEIQMSPQLSVADSDGLGDGKGAGVGDALGAGVEEASAAKSANSSAGECAQGDTDGGGALGEKEWTSKAIREMDKMRKHVERRNGVNEIDGLNVGRTVGGGEDVSACTGAGDGTVSAEAVETPGENGGMEEEDDEESAQRLFIGWMQARQRECVTLVSLGCVTALFVNHVSTSYSGTIPMMVTFIPLAVHLLLVRDIYVKWEDRQRRKSCRHTNLSGREGSGTVELSKRSAQGQHVPPADTAHRGFFDGVGGGLDGGARHPEVAAGGLATGGGEISAETAEGANGHLPPVRPGPFFAGMDVQSMDGGGGGETAVSTSSTDSNTSSIRSGAMGGSRGATSVGGASESEEYWSDFGGRSDSESMGVMNFLETPFQKSVRLLNTACESVEEPIARKVLKTVAKLLSDPDSLHQVKEGSIRRMTMDLGTRNYIENVLQTPVKSTSAEDNWKKLRTGMFVVRAMAREAAAVEDFLSAYNTRHNPKEDRLSEDDAASADGLTTEQNVSELDDLLEDIESGLDTTSQDVLTLNTNNRRTSRAEPYARDIESNRFSRFNRNFIQGQQLVAKTLSRGDLRKDPDRLSVKELRDLVSERKAPEKIVEDPMQAESQARNDDMEGSGDPKNPGKTPCADTYTGVNIPRLPILQESTSGSVAALLADGGFLKWDFNVFTLEERSRGHSLWFAAMLAFSHYNIIGAFGLSVDRLSQLFLCVEASYCYTPEAPNTYHTHVHAADVTLTVSHFLSVDAIANTVRSTHGLALLMAAIMHDYRHPGVNNGYLVRDLDPLAVVYNDVSVLENFHAAEGFKMMLDPTFDILRGWKAEDVKFFRHAFVKCILATDLASSLEYVSKFQSLTTNMASSELSRSTGKGGSKLGGSETISNNSIQVQILVLQMVLKVADVAHPCKPWEVHHRWSELVTEEFFKQGDKEAARGLAVSPLCDRSDQNLPKSQCDFIDFIVRPCVSIFSMYCKVATWNDQLDANFRKWKNLYEEQGGVPRRPISPGSKRRSLR